MTGVIVVLVSIWLGQRAARPAPAPIESPITEPAPRTT